MREGRQVEFSFLSETETETRKNCITVCLSACVRWLIIMVKLLAVSTAVNLQPPCWGHPQSHAVSSLGTDAPGGCGCCGPLPSRDGPAAVAQQCAAPAATDASTCWPSSLHGGPPVDKKTHTVINCHRYRSLWNVRQRDIPNECWTEGRSPLNVRREGKRVEFSFPSETWEKVLWNRVKKQKQKTLPTSTQQGKCGVHSNNNTCSWFQTNHPSLIDVKMALLITDLCNTDLLRLVSGHLFPKNFTPALFSLFPGSSIFLQALADLADVFIIARHSDQIEGVTSVLIPLQDVRDVDVITGAKNKKKKKKSFLVSKWSSEIMCGCVVCDCFLKLKHVCELGDWKMSVFAMQNALKQTLCISIFKPEVPGANTFCSNIS